MPCCAESVLLPSSSASQMIDMACTLQVIVTAAVLAWHVDDSALVSWTANAMRLKAKFNDVFWLARANVPGQRDDDSLSARRQLVLYKLASAGAVS